jgi:hypothetical protein
MEKITINEVEKLAKEHGVEINYIEALNRAIAEKQLKQMPMRCEAVFRLGRADYPERKRTTIVITDGGDDVHIGVKANARVFKADEGGGFSVHEEQIGEIRTLHKDVPLGCLFDSLKELFDIVPEIIDRRTTNGDQA